MNDVTYTQTLVYSDIGICLQSMYLHWCRATSQSSHVSHEQQHSIILFERKFMHSVNKSLHQAIVVCCRAAFLKQHYRLQSSFRGACAAMGQNKRIGTHSGTFHCDEALGCFLLQQTSKFRDSEITRTRDPSVLQELDVVIDVGGVYDPCTLFEM